MCENVGCKVVDCALENINSWNYCKFLHKENKDKAIEAIENQLKAVKKELEEKEKGIINLLTTSFR